MLKNILNLEGVAVLNKKQQGSVNGGQTCKFTMTTISGNTHVVYMDDFAEGSAGSSEANGACAHVASSDNGITRCFYDCAHDGFGQ